MKYCRDFGMKFGLTVGCFTPLSFVEESIYELDRVQVVIHGINDDNWYWRKSSLPMLRKARQLIDERNPNCELCVDGGIRNHNVDELMADDVRVDAMVASTNIFSHPEGITAGVHDFRRVLDSFEK